MGRIKPSNLLIVDAPGKDNCCPDCSSLKVRVSENKLKCDSCGTTNFCIQYSEKLCQGNPSKKKTNNDEDVPRQRGTNKPKKEQILLQETTKTNNVEDIPCQGNLFTNKTKNGADVPCYGTRKQQNMVQGSIRDSTFPSWFKDPINIKILEAIDNGHIQEKIIKYSGLSKNAALNRLKRMERQNLIKKDVVQDEININKRNIIYKQTLACTKILVGDEGKAKHRDFHGHHQKWMFALIQEEANLKLAQSIPCMNANHGLKNNVQKPFYQDSGNTVVLTTKHIVVFVNVRLEADSLDNIIAKYIELAKTEARNFAEENKLKYDPMPIAYQPASYDCISAEPLAKILRERGNFKINAMGIKAEVDPSDEGIESDESNAREIEFRLFKAPKKIMELEEKIDGVAKVTNQLKLELQTSQEKIIARLDARELEAQKNTIQAAVNKEREDFNRERAAWLRDYRKLEKRCEFLEYNKQKTKNHQISTIEIESKSNENMYG